MRATESRGYRNRNPGNIEHVEANKWQGLAEPPSDGRFCRFVSHEYGIRALAALLTTYQDRHGLITVRDIIGRWAPPGENATGAYVAAVVKRTGFTASAPLDLHEYVWLRPLVEAIIAHECAGLAYPRAVIDEGLRLAGVPRPVGTVIDAAGTGTGHGAITVGAAASAAATAAPAIQAMSGLPQWTGVALVLAVAVVAVVIVLTRRRERAA